MSETNCGCGCESTPKNNPLTSFSLTGRTMIVTGGNTGIGASVCRAAAAAGANVVIDYVTHPEAADALVKEIKDAGGNAIAVQADISKVDEIQKLIDAAVAEYGRLDIMVNNAGIESRKSLLESDEADFDRIIGINLKGAYFGTQLAAKQFIKQGCSPENPCVVINMSSVHESWPMPGNNAYCVSKGGLRMLTRNAGVELGDDGVRVVNIAPGAVLTPINASTSADPEKMAKLRETIPVGRLAQPEQIAEAVLFAASSAGSYLTATTITVDGGISMYAAGL